MINTWISKGKGMYKEQRVFSSNYFIKNNCLSCGWGEPALTNDEKIKDYNTYKNKWIEMYGHQRKWGFQGIHHMFESIKKGDFIWTRLNGEYYVVQIPDDPINLFNIDISEEAIKYDCVVQLKNIYWIKCGTEESVPGSISTFTKNRNSLVRVDTHESVIGDHTASSLFSSKIINQEVKLKIHDRKMFFNLIGPSAFEDIIALWLYDKFNYIVIPSTNKTSTQTYEYVLVDGSREIDKYTSKKNIYVQAKNGNVDLFIDEYLHILENKTNELWLVSSRGTIYYHKKNTVHGSFVKVKKENNSYNIVEYDLDLLLKFIFDEKKHNILSSQILHVLSNFE